MAEFVAGVALGEGLTPVGQLRFTQTGPRQSPPSPTTPRGWKIRAALRSITSQARSPFHRSRRPVRNRVPDFR